MKFIDKKLFKFLIVGVINTAVGAGTMFLLYNVAHFEYWPSSAFNYITGGIVSFFLNKFFTFENREKSLRQILLFAANLFVCYILAYIIAKKTIYSLLYFKAENFRANVAMFCGMCLYTILNYFGQRLLVFADKEGKE